MFPNLQSLSLTGVELSDISLLESILPLISNLISFKLFHTDDNHIEKLFSLLPKIHLRTLILPRLFFPLPLNIDYSSIRKLVIVECGLYQLHQFMRNIPLLKYFQIGRFYRSDDYIQNYIKRFSYDYFMSELNYLINLTIVTYRNSDEHFINANRWEHLINSSLPCLKNFRFVFEYPDWSTRDSIETELTKFQSDFWCEEHQWYTEYTFSKTIGQIYTIPYLLNKFEIRSNMERYSNHQFENIHEDTFTNVTELTTVYSNILMGKCQLEFPHVTTMKLEMIFKSSKLRINAKELKRIVKLSNVKHLIIPSYFGIETLSDLSELLIEMPQISSINIGSNSLKSLFQDDHLCQYFNKKITKLNLTDSSDCSMDHLFDLKQFCEIFSNLEELRCNIDQYDSFLFLLKSLPKLSCITVFSLTFPCDSILKWSEQH